MFDYYVPLWNTFNETNSVSYTLFNCSDFSITVFDKHSLRFIYVNFRIKNKLCNFMNVSKYK